MANEYIHIREGDLCACPMNIIIQFTDLCKLNSCVQTWWTHYTDVIQNPYIIKERRERKNDHTTSYDFRVWLLKKLFLYSWQRKPPHAWLEELSSPSDPWTTLFLSQRVLGLMKLASSSIRSYDAQCWISCWAIWLPLPTSRESHQKFFFIYCTVAWLVHECVLCYAVLFRVPLVLDRAGVRIERGIYTRTAWLF